MAEFYVLSGEQALRELKSSKEGLSEQEAAKRLLEFGQNRLLEKKPVSWLQIFLEQFKSPLIIILILAAVASAAIGEEIDAAVILAIVVMNAVIGFVQEYKAEKSIAALKKLLSLKASVLRGGKTRQLPVEELVPGDIIILNAGEKISADIRLLECFEFETQESSLTGESTPVSKSREALKEAESVADMKNMAFSGTIAAAGKAVGVVARTGMRTEIGRIAEMIQEAPEELTPLQIKLKGLGKWIAVAICAIAVIVFISQLFFGTGLQALGFEQRIVNAFLISISLAVAAIPEGLPAIVTIALALGVKKMVSKKALVRRLASVETLGSVDVICSDKTGTITKDEMTVKKLYANHKEFEVTGQGYEASGEFLCNGKKAGLKEIEMVLKIGAVCNNAGLQGKDIIGSPTEACLLVSAKKAGLDFEELQRQMPEINEIPFSSERKRMATVNKAGGKLLVFAKGAPDVMLGLCTRILENGNIRAISAEDRKKILQANEKFASQALRVLGFAFKELKGKEIECDLVFAGMQAMIDPPREEAKKAIDICKLAGIRTIMITGDHRLTAEAIAKQVGIPGKAVTGAELEALPWAEVQDIVEKTNIYARVNPSHKMRIIDALKAKNHIVAMTGDGVNDAPALKKADIGVAMGITGTDVAKESSDIVLLEDNFANIVDAVQEGRIIYDNILKFVNYLLSCNAGEVLVIFAAMLFLWDLPLLAVQILWLNIVTDGLPALALGLDPGEKRIMQRKPRNPKEQIISKKMALTIAIVAVLFAAATLFLYADIRATDPENLARAQTVAFTALVVFEMVRLQSIRSGHNMGLLSNKWLAAAIASSIALQLVLLYTPLNSFFHTVALGTGDWINIIIASIVLYAVMWALGKAKILE